jgi:hypothetical protein
MQHSFMCLRHDWVNSLPFTVGWRYLAVYTHKPSNDYFYALHTYALDYSQVIDSVPIPKKSQG